jgi:DNA-directed RNA polymerase specialized sigma24 family protein
MKVSNFYYLSDQVLLLLSKGGDSVALSVLFKRHNESLVDHLTSICGDRDKAKDLAQDTWLKATETLTTSCISQKQEELFKTWLLHTGREVAHGYLLSKAKSKQLHCFCF